MNCAPTTVETHTMAEHEIFLAALDIADPSQRAAFLEQSCAGDAALRKQVEDLLAAHMRTGEFLDVPALQQMADNLQGTARTTTIDGHGEIDLSFLQPSTDPASLGRLLHYEIREVIGRGGFGIVLKALDGKLERVVAIKVMSPELAATSPARKRFLREARAAAAFRHDNLVGIHAVEEQPLPFLVMDYIDGETLQQRLDRTGPLDVRDVLRIGQQVACGLAVAHAKGLIHRDIKPANILLEAGTNHARITDFGLARSADDASMTQSGTITGTPLYMSPEQAQGHDLDHRSDLFSLGSVLYVMCSGRPPFRAATSLAVLKRVVEEQPRPIRAIIPEVPQWLEAIIARLHAKDPADRFADAGDVSDLLARCLTQLEQGGQVELPADICPVPPEAAVGVKVPASGEPPPTKVSRVSVRKWAAAAMLVALLTCLGMTEATGFTDVRQTVIRFFSPEGTLVVEIDDPGISVSIDGEDMVITGAGAKEIRLKTGEYKLLASKNGEIVQRELVTVTRSGRPVVHIRKESGPSQSETAFPDWEADRKAAEYVLSLGGTVRVNDQSRDLSEADLLPKGPFRLTFINLKNNRQLTASSFTAFRETRNLKGLCLDNALNITDAALADFQHNKQLEYLGVWGSQVSAAGLEHFRDCPGLHSIFLGYSPFNDEDMAFFATFPALPRLTALLLANCPISDQGLSHLQGAEELMQLHLAGTRVTDAGLQPLTSLPKLNWLSLERTAVTDAGLIHLKSCTGLQNLSLLKTNVTAEGVVSLQRALPRCKITWDG